MAERGPSVINQPGGVDQIGPCSDSPFEIGFDGIQFRIADDAVRSFLTNALNPIAGDPVAGDQQADRSLDGKVASVKFSK